VLNVALTGNIAAGKSTVVDLFRRWGATIVDADELVREAEAPGSAVLAAIARRFGGDVLSPDGTLDRPGLRAKVMGDDVALADLNAIVHPVVRRRREELQRQAAARGDAMLVNDIPLLFEALDPAAFDVVVLVDAPAALRRDRLCSLRGLSGGDADRLLAAQMPAERKRPKSDVVIENDGTLQELEARARRVFEMLRRRAAAPGAPWRSVVLAAASARDEPGLVRALLARLTDAGVHVRRVAGRVALLRDLKQAPPDAIIATVASAGGVANAWRRAGRASAHPASYVLDARVRPAGGTPLDLRPWGDAHAYLIDNPLA
jgi:dephospho-CoA kinase